MKAQDISRQSQIIISGNPWYGDSLDAKIEKANHLDWFAQPIAGYFSIAQLIWHMAGWKSYVTAQILGKEHPLTDDHPQNFLLMIT